MSDKYTARILHALHLADLAQPQLDAEIAEWAAPLQVGAAINWWKQYDGVQTGTIRKIQRDDRGGLVFKVRGLDRPVPAEEAYMCRN